MKNVDLWPVCDQSVTSSPSMKVDSYVCWSRMQAEAGQSLEQIIARKERERRLNDGLFFWGVGNAPAILVNNLARLHVPVPVVFSVMKSRPKRADTNPSRTFAWRKYIDADGVERKLPRYSLVTSRGERPTGVKRTHYALVCYSDKPLELRYGAGHFHQMAFRNAGGTGAPVGSSQVTALLRRVSADEADQSDYEVNLEAWLTGGYWVRLTDPVYMREASGDRLAADMSDSAWIELVDGIRGGQPAFGESYPVNPLLI